MLDNAGIGSTGVGTFVRLILDDDDAERRHSADWKALAYWYVWQKQHATTVRSAALHVQDEDTNARFAILLVIFVKEENEAEFVLDDDGRARNVRMGHW